MKTPTIHCMERADNKGLINETGLVSCTKVQLVTAFKAKLRDWLAAGLEEETLPGIKEQLHCLKA